MFAMLIVQSILLLLEIIVWVVWMGTRATEGLSWLVNVVLYFLGMGQ